MSDSGLLAILYWCNFANTCKHLCWWHRWGGDQWDSDWCLLCLFLWAGVLKCTKWAQAGGYKSCGVWQKQFMWRSGSKGFCGVGSCTCSCCLWIWMYHLSKGWCCDLPNIRRQLYVQYVFVQIPFSSSLPTFAVAMGKDKPELSRFVPGAGEHCLVGSPFLRGSRLCRQSAQEAGKVEGEKTKTVQSKPMFLIAVSPIICTFAGSVKDVFLTMLHRCSDAAIEWFCGLFILSGLLLSNI